MSRFPDQLPRDLEVSEVDLDNEQVAFRGDRLTEACAVAVADDVLKRAPISDRQPTGGAE